MIQMIALLPFALFGSTLFAHAARPHIIYVMVDDWGWYNNGFHGNSLIKTPFIDQLVKTESVQLERHYTFKFCSPTRRSFLSGRVPPHNGQDNSAAATVDLRMHTIADKMKSAGYTTGYSGKWHAGHQIMAQIPTNRGFDTSLGYFNGACDHYSQKDGEDRCQPQLTGDVHSPGFSTDIWDTDRPGYGMNGTYGDYLYVGRAVETINKQDPSKPLFYYLAMQCAHEPMQAPQRFLDIYDGKAVPSQVEYAFSSVIDEGIANVTKALKQKGMWDNTLLVVTSDNGGPSFSDQKAASNFPLRGGKYTDFEGGLRTNAFVSGGILPKGMRGKNVSGPVHVCDWYSTFSGLAGVDAKDDQPGVPSIDSIDQWPMLSGATSKAPRSELFPVTGVLIQDNFKLIATGPGHAQWSGPLYPMVKADGPANLACGAKTPCLFDVVADPSERTDLAEKFPEVVKRMTNRLNTLMKGTFDPQMPNVTSAAVCKATAKNGGYLTPSDWTPPGTSADGLLTDGVLV